MLLVLKRLKRFTLFHVQKQLVQFLTLSNTQLQYFTEQYPCIYKTQLQKTRLQKTQNTTADFILANCTEIKDVLELKWLTIEE